jgi:hypothetical protein
VRQRWQWGLGTEAPTTDGGPGRRVGHSEREREADAVSQGAMRVNRQWVGGSVSRVWPARIIRKYFGIFV